MVKLNDDEHRRNVYVLFVRGVRENETKEKTGEKGLRYRESV